MNLTGRQPYQKGQAVKSQRLRGAAKGETCTLLIPGVCLRDPATVVGCHLRLFGFGGAAMKPHDLLMVHACGPCHAVLDDRSAWAKHGLTYEHILRALMETLTRVDFR